MLKSFSPPFLPQEGIAALTVYLVNPKAPVNQGEEYLYSYEEPGENK